MEQEHATSTTERLAQQIDRLLERLAQAEDSQRQLQQQAEALAAERDALVQRLRSARARVDALLEHLPPSSPQAGDATPTEANPS
ncbi:DUF904 domain-containing protein [Corticibacter populi]|uniref:DUF904 domain-containing protein n=1 Tax=Corticibacter populi TaxID=1550736 RepID=A0A3M6QYE7_9BURK|nr:DUF904 domain-containing protein [Corticibacter populi]RMX07941.1 DUF904 domain-containing protein [Corticibacter populi]